MRSVLIAAAVALAAAASLGTSTSCYVGPLDDGASASSGDARDGGEGSASSSDGASGAPREGGGPATGLPCDVEQLLATRCAACHAPPLKAPVRLVTYEDLLGKTGSDPARTLAELAVGRMRSPTAPMPPPPNPAPAPAEIGAMETWIAAGYPHGTCGAPAAVGDGGAGGPSPSSGVVCTSGLTWNSSRRGTTMNPGRACITCHEAEDDDGPIVQIGGTVYPTFHEPDLCYGANGPATGAHVVITDAIGQVFDLPVGPTGNFAKLAGGVAVRMPFRAKVVVGGAERAMATPQSTGDCNSCHTVAGANGAPGRIALP